MTLALPSWYLRVVSGTAFRATNFLLGALTRTVLASNQGRVNVEDVSLALYEYVRLEEASGTFNVSDYFQVKDSAGYRRLYLAGLSGDETIIGSI